MRESARIGLPVRLSTLPDEAYMAIWEYIHGYAPSSNPEAVTFYDHQDKTLYRDLSLDTIGKHGWELVQVFRAPDDKGQTRYEYFFKRQKAQGSSGLAKTNDN